MINLNNIIPKSLVNTKWKSFMNVMSSILQDIKDEKTGTILKHLTVESMDENDFLDIIAMLGYDINLNYTYSLDYLKRFALSLIYKILYKTTELSYKMLFSSLQTSGEIFPMVERTADHLLAPLLNYKTITDIKTYMNSLAPADAIQLTKHILIRITAPYAKDFNTTYTYPLPVAHFKFNEGSGNILINYGTNTINGTHNLPIGNMMQPSVITGGYSYLFNGTSYYANINYETKFKNKSICFWAKQTGTTGDKMFWGSIDDMGHRFFMGLRANRDYIGVGSGTDDWANDFNVKGNIPTYDPSNWNHYILTYTTSISVFSLYVNNIYCGTVTKNQNIAEAVYTIGAVNNQSTNIISNYFDGNIDDFRLYEYIIPQQLRNDIYNSGAGSEDDLVKTGNLRQFFDTTTLAIIQNDVQFIKEITEVPHLFSNINILGNETKLLLQTPVIDSTGNVIPNIYINSITTQKWLYTGDANFGIQLDSTKRLDDSPIWSLDTSKADYLNDIYKVRIGQGLGIVPDQYISGLTTPIFEKIIQSYEKSETSTGGANNLGQYIFDIGIENYDDTTWISEVGLFDATNNLVFYANFPVLNKINGFGFSFKIIIDKS